MSKGPGWIEQRLQAIFFGRKLDNAFTTEELCEQLFSERPIAKKHRVAVLRAAKRLSRRPGCESLAPWRSHHLGRHIVWYHRGNVMSYAMAAMKSDFLHDHNYRNRDERCNWYGNGPVTEKQLRADLKPGGRYHYQIVPGGHWYRHVQEWNTELTLRRAGDKKKLAKFLAAKAAADKARMAKLVAAWKGIS